MPEVLVVEDDEVIGAALEEGLLGGGFAVSRCHDGRSALQRAAVAGTDVVLLDLGLPDLDGLEVCRELRTQCPDALIVILTASSEEMDVVAGLESGADDFLTKPFRTHELLARLRAHLRRSSSSQPPGREVYVSGSLEVDAAARQARVDGTELVLRAKEFELLLRLVMDAGSSVRRETLMADVWDEYWSGSTKTLDVHVSVLRRKLALAGGLSARSPRITTVRGHGYRLDGATTAWSSRG